ncbi:hypothetical protein GCM10025868_11190 [Angustibacter aerolatus]|uniref:Cytochrome P450 n=1 Tax=Angustibacter aerolatus TaxID=1162965 RepID=A0ABQ6JEM2_9ACTN|nr:cytochrome P450 [Angustibacter aerolatus]GMA85869.1 hypothetical protein GCM10025868_11190 [Angustibacter aerolatus]
MTQPPTASDDGALPIRMLHDRVLVSTEHEDGERRSGSGILIPATAALGKRLAWAEVVATGQHVRQVQRGDRVLFDPDERAEVEPAGRGVPAAARARHPRRRRPARRRRPDRAVPLSARRNARYTPLDVDGPVPREMVRDVPAIRRDALGYLARTTERFGDLVAFPMPGRAALLVNDPAAVRRVLVERPRAWSKDTVQYGALSAVTGAGLLTADGDDWRRRRRIAQPAFHHGTLDVVAEQSVAAARRVSVGWHALPDGAVTDVDAACMQATLEVVGRTLFDDDLAADGERVVSSVAEALEVVVQRARTPRPAWLPLPSARRLARAVAVLDETCARLVAARRARGLDDHDTDLLGLLLRSADAEGGLTPQQVRDEPGDPGDRRARDRRVVAGLDAAPARRAPRGAAAGARRARRPRRAADLGRPAPAAVHPPGGRRGAAVVPAGLGGHPARDRARRAWPGSPSRPARWS